MTPRRFSSLPPTQQPIVAALLDGIAVRHSYHFSMGARGGASEHHHTWCPHEPMRDLGPRAGSAASALRDKGIVTFAASDDSVSGKHVRLVSGAIIDDRAEAL